MQGKQPDDSNNLILAVVLSMAVLLAWQVFFPPQKLDVPKPGEEQVVDAASGREGAVPAAGVDTSGAVRGEGGSSVGTNVRMTRERALGSEQRVKIDTPSLIGSLNLLGGRIDDLVLKKYRVEAPKDSPNVVLFSPAKAPNPYFAEHGWTIAPGSKTVVPSRDSEWKLEDGAQSLTPETPVTLSWHNGSGLVFKRTISVDKDYMFSIKDEVENRSSVDVTLFPYARIYRYGTPKIAGFWIQHEGLIGWIGEERLKELTYSGAQEPGGSQHYEKVLGGWLGFTDKYWAATLVPDQKIPVTVNMKLASSKNAISKEAYQADYLSQPLVVPADGKASYSSQLFAGAKQVKVIENYEVANGILQFDYLIDWGWFDFITYPLYHLIDWFNQLFGNFGLAILACTVVVKLAFYPLANKAYVSMARMKALQPKMEEIKKKHGEDKQAQQKAMMELYQKEKINPVAGCLPILFQIPVFFALYKVLFISIDMRHAPFFGWIQDLSAPDPTSIFNLFGLLPFAVPEFLMIGVWPLLMGITMWLQMQLNPPQPDPTQQMVFNWMPVLFTFLLATFPAGLVIYWTWNNILSIAQQWYIMRKEGVDVPILDNIKKTFAVVGDMWSKKSKDKGGS